MTPDLDGGLSAENHGSVGAWAAPGLSGQAIFLRQIISMNASMRTLSCSVSEAD
jgi:hypothetical protein